MKLRHIALATGIFCSLAAPVPAQQPPAGQRLVIEEDRPGLLAQATVRPDVAFQTARARVPGGQLREAEIDMERNRLVYGFEFTVPGQRGTREVKVDARTGEVIAIEDEAEDDDEDRDDDAEPAGGNRPPRPPA